MKRLLSPQIGCLLVVILSFGGCAHYAPPKVDAKTGLYSTGTKLDKASVLTRKTGINLSRYGFAFLKAQSNVYPSRFEFFVREALARMGVKHVLNAGEIKALTDTVGEEADTGTDGKTPLLSKLSKQYGPFLAIGFTSEAVVDRRIVRVKIVDAGNGEVLLEILHDKFIWVEVDSEAHYPVINEIKQWIVANSSV